MANSALAWPVVIFPSLSACWISSGRPRQAKRIRHDGPVFSDDLGNGFLRQLKFFLQTLKPFGQFDRVEIFALKIFDQRHFKAFAFRSRFNEDGNFFQARALGRPPAALARNNFISSPLRRRNQDRLKNSFFFMDWTEIGQRLFRKNFFAAVSGLA